MKKFLSVLLPVLFIPTAALASKVGQLLSTGNYPAVVKYQVCVNLNTDWRWRMSYKCEDSPVQSTTINPNQQIVSVPLPDPFSPPDPFSRVLIVTEVAIGPARATFPHGQQLSPFSANICLAHPGDVLTFIPEGNSVKCMHGVYWNK